MSVSFLRRTLVAILPLLFLCSHMNAQKPYNYELSWPEAAQRLYQVALTTAPADGGYTEFSMPAWRPGRYIMQNFAAGINRFRATDEQGNALAVRKVTKDTWRVANPTSGNIRISYTVYANVQDAGSAYVTPTMAYFNPHELFMYVNGRWNDPVNLHVLNLPADWKVASQLEPVAGKHGHFTAESYHDFIDSPTILSPTLKQIPFEVDGVSFTAHFQGPWLAPAEADKFFADKVSAIVRAQKAFFGDLPFKRYDFIYYLLPMPIRHAVEHSRSAMFAMPQEVGMNTEGLESLWSVTSHEFFHLWNVKRIRPAALWPYDYRAEQYTSLHWLTEGITDYYADVMVARAGIITPDNLLNEIAGNITALENNYAQYEISPAQASMDSWLATSNYVDPHTQISYYPLGLRVGFLLDVEIRRVTANAKSLDDVMRWLYNEYYKKGQGVPENGVQIATEAVTGQSFAAFFQKYVDGVAPLDYKSILEPMGLELKVTPNPMGGLRNLGISRTQRQGEGVALLNIIPGSDAAKAGLPPRVLLMQVDGKPVASVNLDEKIAALKPGDKIRLTVGNEAGAQEFTIEFSGKNVIVKCELVRTADTKAAAWVEGWATGKAPEQPKDKKKKK